jgi:hypothetical protein
LEETNRDKETKEKKENNSFFLKEILGEENKKSLIRTLGQQPVSQDVLHVNP